MSFEDGVTPEEGLQSSLDLGGGVARFKLLTPHSHVEGRDGGKFVVPDCTGPEEDLASFGDTCAALAAAQFTPAERGALFRLLATLLHLSNIDFVTANATTAVAPGQGNLIRNHVLC